MSNNSVTEIMMFVVLGKNTLLTAHQFWMVLSCCSRTKTCQRRWLTTKTPNPQGKSLYSTINKEPSVLPSLMVENAFDRAVERDEDGVDNQDSWAIWRVGKRHAAVDNQGSSRCTLYFEKFEEVAGSGRLLCPFPNQPPAKGRQSFFERLWSSSVNTLKFEVGGTGR